MFLSAPAIVEDVAHVSAPPKALSVTRTASSAPIANASLSATSACGGPIDTTVKVDPGTDSLI